MSSELPEASHCSSAYVGHGVMNTGHGNVTIGHIAYNNQNAQAQQRRRTLKDSLDFPERSQRERTIRNTHRETGRWFLRTQEYLNWQPSGPPRTTKDDRPSDYRSEEDSEDGQGPARCCGIFPKARKALRSAHRSKGGVRQDPNHRTRTEANQQNPISGSSMQTDWRQRLLWIKGNAGAGKSTLLKMAVDHDRMTHTQALILPHFFNARGTELEHSTEGMYRALICWLLESQPTEFAIKLDPTGTRAAIQNWDTPELERLLDDAMSKMNHASVVFYIDALDECEETQVREMLEYFRKLVSTAWEAGRELRVCFASRPYPHITFEDAVFLDLSQQPEHIRDIERYISDRLRIEEGTEADELRGKLLKKAAGVFMWAVLVTDMLNKTCDNGRVDRLPQVLEEIPPGLHELFAHTLERYPEDREAMLVCFRWALFSDHNMTPSQMWWAVQLGLGLGDEQIQENYGRMSESAIKRYIVGISKGFVEITRSSGVVGEHTQFVHESFRDFLFNERSLQRLYGARNCTDFAGQSHELLRDWLTAEVVARRPRLLQAVNENGVDFMPEEDLVKMGWSKRHPKASIDWMGEGRLQFPLARPASFDMWRQLEAAQQCGRDQKSYLDNVLKLLPPYSHLSPWYGGGGCLISYDIISSLLLHNCATVIQHTQLESAQLARRAGRAFGLFDSRSRHSPVADARRNADESVRALVQLYLQLEPWHADLRKLLLYLARSVLRWPQLHPINYDSWSPFGPLLDLAVVDASLATFFILVLASPGFLLHLDTLKQLARSEADEDLLFIKVLLCFVEHDLHTDVLDYSCEDTLKWALNQGRYYTKEVQTGREVLGALETLISLLRVRYHSEPSSFI